jgi:REP element-mobilizing transposase RayT
MNQKRRLSSLRLGDYDYSQEGIYFVTICTQDHKHFFGKIENGKMVLNEIGKIAEKEWLHTENMRKDVRLGTFVIMPNHIHGLICILDPVGAHCNAPLQPTQNNLSWIIRGFKSTTTKKIRKIFPKFKWQRSFYDHIVRSDDDLEKIHEYIIFNPEKWELDKYFSPQ